MEQSLYLQKITLALARGAATGSLRQINSKDPITWEFSAFSQSGEDGIIDYLCRKILEPNYYFYEIGASTGIENNSSWLALARQYDGVMIEGDLYSFNLLQQFLLSILSGVKGYHCFVDLNKIEKLIELSLYNNPDLFSLDIDGNDYYIAESFLNKGFRPKIFVVEYNSAFGPENAITIKYDEKFSIDFDNYENYLYYGASISAWKKLLESYNYKFVTVDRRGVNAFFIDPNQFNDEFTNGIKGLEFAENFFQLRKYNIPHSEQFELIKDKEYIYI
jgi:hypothetical protein